MLTGIGSVETMEVNGVTVFNALGAFPLLDGIEDFAPEVMKKAY